MVNSLGFTRCKVDQAVFFKLESNNKLMIVVVHVDDCMIAGSSLALVMDLKKWVAEHVEVMLQFNLMRVEICELRPKVVTKDDGVLVHYQSRTNV